MKSNTFIPLAITLILLPLVAQAKYEFDGTDTDGTQTTGEPVGDNVYEFEMWSKDATSADSNMLGISSLGGQWWVGDNSGTPWQLYQSPDGTNTHPSFHVTDDLVAGSSFFVGLSMQHQMKDYTSHFRITNDVLPTNTQVYFGLRNFDSTANGGLGAATPGVLLQDANGDPLRTLGGKGALHHISDETGLAFQGSSTGLEAPTHTPDTTGSFDANEFEWIHYQTQGVDDTTFEIKLSGDGNKNAPPESALILTEWVAYFVIPDDATLDDGVTPWTLDNTAWGDTVPNSATAGTDLVFSWTVDAKSGYGNTNPQYDTPDSVLPIPEPASVLMLFLGSGMLCLKRQRRVA